ncbi:MAG: prevent-host-death protein [Chthonomonadetes bacterium]|nr:prevent-host-death protein [Chthonomonadetes bacterium]
MRIVTPEEAREQLSDLLISVLKGDTVLIATKEGMVQLTAISAPRQRQFGSARGMVTFGEDFDAPLDDFLPYMQ